MTDTLGAVVVDTLIDTAMTAGAVTNPAVVTVGIVLLAICGILALIFSASQDYS